MSAHVVLLAWIGKEVGLCAGLDAGIKETQTVLWYYSIVVVACDNLQLAFQILGLANQTTLGIPLRVILWCAHITFSIHDLVPLPIDNGTTGTTHLEDLGVSKFHGDGHEATEAPTLHAHAVLVHIGQALEEFYSLHLVGHLNFAEVAVGAAFELEATVVGAAVIDGEDHIALLGEEHEIEVAAAEPAVGHELRVRATVDVDEGRVFLALLHIGRRNQAVV